MGKKITVRELWWEGNDLYIIATDGSRTIFGGAYITKQDTVFSEKNASIIVQSRIDV